MLLSNNSRIKRENQYKKTDSDTKNQRRQDSMKRKKVVIGAVVAVLLGYGLLANGSKDNTQQTGQGTAQTAQETETEQKFGGVLI